MKVPAGSVIALMQRAMMGTNGLVASARVDPCFYAELSTGERVRAWTMEFSKGILRITHKDWGPIEFAASTVRRLVVENVRLPEVSPSFTGVRYVNGDIAGGEVVSISRDGVLVDVAGIGKVPITELATVTEIALTGAPLVKPPTPIAEVFLQNGERVQGKVVGGNERILNLAVAWKREPLAIPLDWIMSVYFGQGRTLLSALTPVSVAQIPYFDFQRPWRRDESLLGSGLKVGGFAAGRGVALHAKTRLDYVLPEARGGGHLVAWVGVDDAIVNGVGEAGVMVLVDGIVMATIPVRSGGGLVPVFVETVTNAARLSITADFGSNGSIGAHVDVLYPVWEAR